MNITKIFMSVFALFSLFFANVNISYAVTVDDEAIEGTFTKAEINETVNLAAYLIDEITRESYEFPEYETKLHFGFSKSAGDTSDLLFSFLDKAEGVSTYWRTFVDDLYCGDCADLSALFEALDAMLYERANSKAVSLSFLEEIAFDNFYTYTDKNYNLSSLVLKIRENTSVISVATDGEVFLS